MQWDGLLLTHDSASRCQTRGVTTVRSGTSTTEATHDDLQRIGNKRIETGYSSKHVLELSEHLQQLKELYKQKPGYGLVGATENFLVMMEGDRLRDYHEFISDLIERKKRKIVKLLAL